MWGNTGGDIRSMGSAITVGSSTYGDAAGSVTPDVTCMQADPGFVDPGTGDFRLQPWSLAINSGNDGYNTLTNDILNKARKVFGIDRGINGDQVEHVLEQRLECQVFNGSPVLAK